MDKFEKILKKTTVFCKNPKLSPENIGFAKEDFAEYFLKEREGSRLFSEEIEKTPEQTKIINIALKFINEELKILDIDEQFELPVSKIHFLPSNFFEQGEVNTYVGKGGTYKRIFRTEGQIDNLSHEITLNANLEKLKLFHTAVHELIHAASYEKYHLCVDAKIEEKDSEEKIEINNVIGSRSGYKLPGNNNKTAATHFDGLNEMVIEKIFTDICERHKKELKKEIDLSRTDIRKLINHKAFNTYSLDILNLIIEEIARVKEEKIGEVLKRFKRGLFTGEITHIRDIERVFGEGALRILSLLNFYNDNDNFTKKQENENKVLIYLVTKDKAKREKLAEEIFKSVEFKEININEQKTEICEK